MKIFVDTGSIKEIEAIAALGILDGVTTNPSLLAKEPGDFSANLKKICDIVKGPVSGEVIATDFAGMMREGHDIAKIDEHMIVKLPLTRDGIKACKALSDEGIGSTSRCASRPRRRCSPRRPARRSSARSWDGSTTSRRTAWS